MSRSADGSSANEGFATLLTIADTQLDDKGLSRAIALDADEPSALR